MITFWFKVFKASLLNFSLIVSAPQLEPCQSRCGPSRRGTRPSPTATSPAPSTGWAPRPSPVSSPRATASPHTGTVLYCTVLYCTVLYCTVLPAHRDFGHFYGSSYVAAPDGSRTPGLSRTRCSSLPLPSVMFRVQEHEQR